ncbi:187_t:CDS:2 [Scutellospora calospora]|uniref:187_t:CDS:1 n=1 Tax=Scutellospora calospora TaxID=85575 RepID=A0ACA9JVF1_9GLOM|nr:187_t:CDS:2 [Scutellospora calospora]
MEAIKLQKQFRIYKIEKEKEKQNNQNLEKKRVVDLVEEMEEISETEGISETEETLAEMMATEKNMNTAGSDTNMNFTQETGVPTNPNLETTQTSDLLIDAVLQKLHVRTKKTKIIER